MRQAPAPAASTPPEEPCRVFHVAELEALGVSQSTSYRRARADGPWSRLAPGIILTTPGPATTDDLMRAALLRAGPAAIVTGLHGARLHGLKASAEDEPIHVLIPHSQKVQSHPSITYERTTRLPNPVMINGIPTAPLVRAVIDGARKWKSRALTEGLLVEAIQHGRRCRPAQLLEEIELGSRRGTGLPREILRSMSVDIRSVPELKAFKLLQSSELPAPRWNVQLFDQQGNYVGCPDAWFDDVGLAVEIDSFEFHFTKSGYANTTRRNTRYAMNSVLVVQVLPGQLGKEPQVVLDSISRAYRTAVDRGRPNVVIYKDPTI